MTFYFTISQKRKYIKSKGVNVQKKQNLAIDALKPLVTARGKVTTPESRVGV